MLRHHAWRRALLVALAAAFGLVACDGGGGNGPQAYRLRIDSATVTVAGDTALLQGEGFVPPGSSCPGGCEGLLPPPVFGDLGPYTLRWENAASGQSGAIGLHWICNCGGSAPYWSALVPLVAGENRIIVSERAGPVEQSDEVIVTRP